MATTSTAERRLLGGDLGVQTVVDQRRLDRTWGEQRRDDGDGTDDDDDCQREPAANRADHEPPPVSW